MNGQLNHVVSARSEQESVIRPELRLSFPTKCITRCNVFALSQTNQSYRLDISRLFILWLFEKELGTESMEEFGDPSTKHQVDSSIADQCKPITCDLL